MVQTGGGSDAIFTRGFKYVVRHVSRARPASSRRPRRCSRRCSPRPQTYSVIYNNDAFSKTAAEGVKLSCDAAGFKRLDSYELPAKVTDVSSVLASVRANTPDLLVCVDARPGFAAGRAPDGRHRHQREAAVPGPGPAARLLPRGAGQICRGDCCARPTGTRRVPYKDEFFGDSEEIRRLLPQQVHPPDRLPHGRL